MEQAADQTQAVRVAILDDHALIRDAVTAALTAAGFEVVVSEREPLAFLAGVVRHQPAVALVDLKLDDAGGGHEGLQILKHLRGFHPTVRTLVLSAVRDSAIMRQCLDAGAYAFLEKRTTLGADLVPAVQAAALGQPWAAPASPAGPTHGGSAELRSLTQRELQVLAFISGGADNLKIAAHLEISERTVKAHVQSLYRKLGGENRSELTLRARELGVLPPFEA